MFTVLGGLLWLRDGGQGGTPLQDAGEEWRKWSLKGPWVSIRDSCNTYHHHTVPKEEETEAQRPRTCLNMKTSAFQACALFGTACTKKAKGSGRRL